MPRVNLPHTQITRAGVAPGAEVSGDATNNHSVVNDGNVFLLARNSGAGARTVTIVTPGTVDTQAVADRVISITAAESRYIGPFPPGDYGDPVNVDVEHTEVKLTAYHLS
jgi:hypothetical protein